MISMISNDNMTVRLAMSNSPDGYVTRRGGSYVEGLVMDGENVRPFLAGLDWHEVTEEIESNGTQLGNCRYFKAQIDRPAFLGARTLASMSFEELKAIRVEAAHHPNRDGSERGELVLDTIEPTPVDFIVIAIGNPRGPFSGIWTAFEGVVYTWHPGMPMHSGPVPGPNVEETRRQFEAGLIHPQAAVKLSAK